MMNTMRVGGGLRAVVLAALALGAGAVAGQAQQVGLGYVLNGPSMIMGGAVYGVLPVAGGLGLYVDAKLDFDSPENDAAFESDLTPQDALFFGDSWYREADSWQGVNVALMRPLTPTFMVYAGAGWAERTHFDRYQDTTRQRGRGGSYWIEDPDGSGTEVNFLGGALLAITPRFRVHVGGETAPTGFTVGASYLLVGGPSIR